MSLQDVLDAYGAAWSDDGVYIDPQTEARGREALSSYIGAVHAKMPGARIEYTSGIARHHAHIHFSWRLVTAESTVALEGVDFGTLGPDGRLCQIVGFFGDLPQP